MIRLMGKHLAKIGRKRAAKAVPSPGKLAGGR